MMKKQYESPEFEVILLDLADVIRASGDPWDMGGSTETEDDPIWG